jgi:C4-dicarboxylate transporter DctM subunit
MLATLLITFTGLLLLGVPVAVTMGLAAVAALLQGGDVPLIIVPQRMLASVYSFPLMAVPFFMLAGELMEKGGISKRLVDFAKSLVGQVRGSLAIVSVLASMVFAGISGAATADASAIGSILVPSMISRGYNRGFAAALVASASAIGPIIPPSVIMIVYGSISGVSIARMFMGGIIPGLLIGLALMAYSYWYARKHGYEGEARANARQVWDSFKEAAWALLSPVLILGGILSGMFTATEAGVVAVVYAFVIGCFVYREIKWSQLQDMLVRAALTSTIVLFMISTAGIFGWILGREQVPLLAANWITSLTSSPAVVIALVILFLLVIGCFIEIMAATIILVPVLFPLAQQFHIDPVHWAVLICITLTLGGVTPPVGILLYITTSIAKIPLRESVKPALPMVAIMIAVLLLVAYVPATVTWIPHALMK